MLGFYQNHQNAFRLILEKYPSPLTVQDLLAIYRNHFPEITISEDTKKVLDFLKSEHIDIGLITDGRSTQQRNKIKALGIESYFSEILISEEFGSEKPSLENFQHFENFWGKGQYCYIADNIKKDFIAPNKLNWVTVHLRDNGLNIHKSPENLKNSKVHRAQFEINQLPEILDILFLNL